MFPDSNIRYDVGSELVIVRHAGNKLILQAEEENFEEPIKNFDTITNMEEIKRAFFNGDYDIFESQLKESSFKLLRAKYKYNSDKD
jgi:hypothetical protein